MGTAAPAAKCPAMTGVARIFLCLALLWSQAAGSLAAAAAEPPQPADAVCPASPMLFALDAGHTRYAVGLRTWGGSGRGSGTVTLYAHGTRYDVPFSNLIIADMRDGETPTPLVLTFPAPVDFEGAAVTALGGPCSPLYSPWTASPTTAPSASTRGTGDAPLNTAYARFVAKFKAAAAAAPSSPAPLPLADTAPSCATPYQPARTLRVIKRPGDELGLPHVSGELAIFVTIGADDRVIDATPFEPSAFPEADRVATQWAKDSQYRTQTFRCQKVVGTYIFTVGFST